MPLLSRRMPTIGLIYTFRNSMQEMRPTTTGERRGMQPPRREHSCDLPGILDECREICKHVHHTLAATHLRSRGGCSKILGPVVEKRALDTPIIGQHAVLIIELMIIANTDFL